ncbi:hypothetical protein [Amycolatopsis sp. w19]|uniref:hypothetical protein n=1 Tax=Amycolatopsis sp. w19 TaxID=3448134 RepID=UPI003F1ABC48
MRLRRADLGSPGIGRRRRGRGFGYLTPDGEPLKDEETIERVLALARRLPRLRRTIQEDLASRGLTRERVLAGALSSG